MYLISVILPVYNVEDYLDRCLNSLLGQTIGFENLEILFIDDCSKDNSYEIIKEYSKQYDNIKVYQTENNSGSAGRPRNIGLKNASADYIMFLDPDDVYFEDACEKLYFNCINVNAEVTSGNYIKLSDGIETKLINFSNVFNTKVDYVEFESVDEYPRVLTMIPALWAKIYKKSFLKRNNITFPENVLAQDLYFVVLCLIKSRKTVFVDTPIVKYEIRNRGKSKSVTANVSKKNLLSYAYVYNRLHDLLKDYNEKYAYMAAIHLHFCTGQFVKAKDKQSKLEYLYTATNLYSIFKNRYKPQEFYEDLFKLINEKKFIDAIKFSELLFFKLTDTDEILKNIKDKEIIMLYDDSDEKRVLNQLIKEDYHILLENNFKIKAINTGLFGENNEILTQDDQNNTDVFDNTTFFKDSSIFEYFHENYSLNGKISTNILEKTQHNDAIIITENYIINNSLDESNDKKTLLYYNKTDFNEAELKIIKSDKLSQDNLIKVLEVLNEKTIIKSEVYLKEYLFIKKLPNNNETLFYTQDGYVYLTEEFKSDDYKLIFNNRFNNQEIIFESEYDFKKYFLNILNLRLNEKLLLYNPNNRLYDEITAEIYRIYSENNLIKTIKKSYLDKEIDDFIKVHNIKKYEYNLKELNTSKVEGKRSIKNNEESQYNIQQIIDSFENEINTYGHLQKENDEIIYQQKNTLNQNHKDMEFLKNQIDEMSYTQENNEKTISDTQQQIKQYTDDLNHLLDDNKENLKNIKSMDEIISNLEISNRYYDYNSTNKKKMLNVLPYLYIIYNRKEIANNIKLYRKIHGRQFLDISFYLKHNKDISKDKWCKLLNLETHYVCHGFDENRHPNSRYNCNLSKKELIEKLDNE